MYWEDGAKERSKKLVEKFTEELRDEAERIAQRLKAGGVSGDYVDQAADRIGMRRPSGAVGDILLTVGAGLVFAAVGVWTVVVTEPTSTHLQLGLVKPAAIAALAGGLLLAGIGITLKVKS